MSSGPISASNPSSDGAEPPSQGSAQTGGPGANLHRLGKYEIRQQIGAGGMGAVYLAVDPELQRQIALKLLPKEKAENATLVKRFKAEAQAAAHLKHENIVTVYDAGEIGGHLYIALEYVDGFDVFHMITRRGPFPVKRSIQIVRQVARALEHAHQQNIVHRDIKPSNLLITRDGTVKLTDLGLARSMDEATATSITRAGTTVGTVDYMAPEQARDSRSADIRSDIYSLGCTWYHMLAGEPPYPAGSLTNKLAAHASQPLPDPRAKNRAVPDAVVAVMHRMMAKKPDDRYQSPGELLADLDNQTLLRDTISDDVLSALAGDSEAQAEPASTSPSPRSRKTAPNPSSRSRAPESRRDGRRRGRRSRTTTRGNRTPVGERASPPPAKRAPHTLSPPERKPPPQPVQRNASQFGFAKFLVWAAIIGAIALVVWAVATRIDSAPEHPDVPIEGNPYSSNESELEQTSHPANADDTEKPATVADAATDEAKRSKSPRQAPNDKTSVSKDHSAKRSATEVGQWRTSQPWERSAERSSTARPAASMRTARRGEQKHWPHWISQTDSSETTSARTPRDGPPELTVGRSESGPAQFSDLSAALDELPESGAIIRLIGGGPFRLPPKRITRCHDLRIVASSSDEDGTGSPSRVQTGSVNPARLSQEPSPTEASARRSAGRRHKSGGPLRPVILCVPGPEKAADRMFEISDGSLTLQGLDIVLFSEPFAEHLPSHLVAVHSGDLIVQDCSVMVPGLDGHRRTAFRVDGPAALSGEAESATDPTGAMAEHNPGRGGAPQPRVLLDRLFVRGENLAAVEIGCASADLVANNCLFVTGEAPLLTLEPASVNPVPAVTGRPADRLVQRPALRTETADPSPKRTLRLLSCTGYSSRTAFEFLSSRHAPSLTEVLVLNSLVGAGPVTPDDDSALLWLADWPQADDRGADQPLFRNLRWQVRSSLFLGWNHLARIVGDDSFEVQGAARWQTVWPDSLHNAQFQPEPWPTFALDDLIAVTPQQLASSTVEGPEVQATDGGRPGCLIEHVPSPPSSVMSLGRRLAARPELPAPPLDSSSTKHRVEVDLNRRDLGMEISGGEWPDGTTFVASGAGFQECSPIDVQGKSFRIRFVQSAGSPLVLAPRTRKWKDGEAWITVRNGDVEILDGHLRIPASKSSIIPHRFLDVTDGSFVLSNCRLLGPMLTETPYRGAIRWTHSHNGETARNETPAGKAGPSTLVPGPSSLQQTGRIIDSYVAGTGQLLRADLTRRMLSVDNSLLVSLEDVFDLNLRGSEPDDQATIDLRSCTLSARGTFFNLPAYSSPHPRRPRLRLFVDETVFAPPVPSRTARVQPTLIRAPGLRALSQTEPPPTAVQWWGMANGYAPEIAQFVEEPAGSSEGMPDFETDWRNFWGPDHVRYPITGPRGVLLKADLPQKAVDVRPRHFGLHPTSTASRWSAGNRPIGADVASLQLPDPDTVFEGPDEQSQPRSHDQKKTPADPTPKRVKPDF